MKALEVKTHEIELGGQTGEASDFSVKIDGHIFKLMTDGLYSAKVPSVVREILANAIDAQIQSGRKEAVRVSLPTPFNKTFRVRDFGDGMSHEFVMKLYTQLGHSTKRDDNTQTGFFGMGSKSPFTITDQFQVTVFDGKHKRVYSAFIADNGVPRLTNPINMASSEPAGVEVSVPVPAHFVADFESAIKASAFAYFDKDITFNRDFGGGDQPLVWAQKTFKKIADGVYTVRERTAHYSYSSSGACFIRQGFAVYPLELEQLTSKGGIDSATLSFIRRLTAKSTKLYLDAPIGTFNVTASREKIQYDAPSIQNISALLLKLMQGAMVHISQQVTGVYTHSDAVKQLQQAFLKEYAFDEDGKATEPDISEVVTSANDLHELFKPDIEKNYRARYGLDKPQTATQAAQNIAKVKPLGTKFTVREQAICPSAKFYTSSASFYYNDDNTAVVGGASFSRSESLTWDILDLTYIVPAVLKHWQERVFKHATEVIKKRYGIFASTYRCTLHVIRCNRMDTKLAAQKLMEHDVHILEPLAFEDDLPVYVPDASTAAVVRKGYSKTAVYPIKRSTSSYGWGWDETKVEAPSDEPAYYITRVGIGSSVHLVSEKLAADTAAVKRSYASKAAGAVNFFRPHHKIDNSQFFRALQSALEAGLIEADVPVYRVTERQRDKLIEKPDDHEWIDLGALLVEKLIAEFERVVVADHNNLYKTVCDVSTPRVMKTLIDEMFDLIAADDKMDSGIDFASVSRQFLRDAPVFGTAGLFELPALLKSDAFALFALPAYLSDARSEIGKKNAESSKAVSAVLAAVSALFGLRPVLPEVSTRSAMSKLMTTLNDEFGLLFDLNYLDGQRGRHVMRYLTASVNEANVKAVTLTDYPELVALVTALRDEATTAVTKFTTHQKRAAKAP